MRIGEYIKCRRSALGYTQQSLADSLSVSKQAVNKWENDLSLPDIMIIPELAAILKVSTQFIMDAIWLGNSEALISHFVFISAVEKSGEAYVIHVIESKDYLPAKERYDSICGGGDGIIKVAAEYYEHDNSRRIIITLEESEYDRDGEFPARSLMIESCDLTCLIEDYLKKDE